MSVEETSAIFTEPGAMTAEFLQQNFVRNIAELRTRESQCQIVCTDMIEKNASSARLFYVMNHPHVSVLYFVMQQLMNAVGVEPLPESILTRYAGALNLVKWPITASVVTEFQLPFRQDEFELHGRTVPLQEFVRLYFDYYAANPAALEKHIPQLNHWFAQAIA